MATSPVHEIGPARCGNTGEPSTIPAITRSKEYAVDSVSTTLSDRPAAADGAPATAMRSSASTEQAVSRRARTQDADLHQENALRSIGCAFSETGRMLWYLDLDLAEGSRVLKGFAERLRAEIDAAVEREIQSGREPGGWARG